MYFSNGTIISSSGTSYVPLHSVSTDFFMENVLSYNLRGKSNEQNSNDYESPYSIKYVKSKNCSSHVISVLIFAFLFSIAVTSMIIITVNSIREIRSNKEIPLISEEKIKEYNTIKGPPAEV